MDLLRVLILVAPLGIAYALIWAGTRSVIKRQRANSGALRSEIEAHVRFATTLDAARVNLVTLSLRRDSHGWFSLRGPRRLIVGANAFAFEAPNSLREYVFKAAECSIAFSQAPSSPFVLRNWIVISGPAAGRQVQLAISNDNLMAIFQALTAAGAATWSHPSPSP